MVWARYLAGATVVALLAPSALPAGKEPKRQPGVLVGINAMTGEQRYRKLIGSSLEIKLASGNTVLVKKQRCFSDDELYKAGDIALVGYDAATGKRRWHRRDVALAMSYLDRLDEGPLAAFDLQRPIMYVFDPQTGEELWSKHLGHRRSPELGRYTPDVSILGTSDDLFFITDVTDADLGHRRFNGQRDVRAVNRMTGRVRWRYSFERGELPGAVIADDNRVALNTMRPRAGGASRDRTLKVLDARDGHLIREDRGLTPYVHEMRNGVLIVGATRPGAVGVDPDSGVVVRDPAPSANVLLPRPKGSYLEAQSGFTFIAADAQTGEERWRVRYDSSGAATEDATVIAMSTFRDHETRKRRDPAGLRVHGFKVSTGEEVWAIDHPKGVGLGVAIRDTVVLAGGCPTTAND